MINFLLGIISFSIANSVYYIDLLMAYVSLSLFTFFETYQLTINLIFWLVKLMFCLITYVFFIYAAMNPYLNTISMYLINSGENPNVPDKEERASIFGYVMFFGSIVLLLVFQSGATPSDPAILDVIVKQADSLSLSIESPKEPTNQPLVGNESTVSSEEVESPCSEASSSQSSTNKEVDVQSSVKPFTETQLELQRGIAEYKNCYDLKERREILMSLYQKVGIDITIYENKALKDVALETNMDHDFILCKAAGLDTSELYTK